MNVEIELIKVATNVGTLGLTFYLVYVLARTVKENAPSWWRILEIALNRDKECPECAKRKKEEKKP